MYDTVSSTLNLCKKLTVRLEPQNAKIKGRNKAAIKSAKEELAKCYGTDTYVRVNEKLSVLQFIIFYST